MDVTDKKETRKSYKAERMSVYSLCETETPKGLYDEAPNCTYTKFPCIVELVSVHQAKKLKWNAGRCLRSQANKWEVITMFFFFHGKTASIVGQGLLNVEASRSHWDTPLSVELLWTGDQPDAETYNSLTSGIRTHNPSSRTAEDPCLRRRGHLDRNSVKCSSFFLMKYYCFFFPSKYYPENIKKCIPSCYEFKKNSSCCKSFPLPNRFAACQSRSSTRATFKFVLDMLGRPERSSLRYPFDHFRNLCLILRHAALSLCRRLWWGKPALPI
jgi:hypothetical protein